MAYEKPTEMLSLDAAADYRTKQFYFMKVNSDGDAELAGAGENAVGVLQDTPNIGEVGNVMTLGISKVVAGGIITAGSNVSSNASGAAVVTTGSAAILGIALAAAVADDIFPVLLVTRTSSGVNTNFILAIPVKLVKVADGDVVTTYTPGFAGTIVKVAFLVTDPVTTAEKATTLNLEIGTTNLTGGVLALTSANCTPLGAVIDGTAITAANTFADDDTISVEAASTTAFVEGEGVLLITIQ